MYDMARSPFSTAAFARLVLRLRHTNARYNQIALQFRCSVRRTYHAKRRAQRVGLRVDTTKARACPNKYVSTHPPPVLDLPEDGLGWPVASPSAYATAETSVSGAHSALFDHEGVYMRRPPLQKPEVIVRKRRGDGQSRIVLRLPPLKLHLDMDYQYSAPFDGPVPGAPKLVPRQLPEDDCGTHEEMCGSESYSSSATDGPEQMLNPFGVQVYSGLCITIPPRPLKRKLEDVEPDEDTTSPQQPKRSLKARWDDSQRQ